MQRERRRKRRLKSHYCEYMHAHTRTYIYIHAPSTGLKRRWGEGKGVCAKEYDD